MRLNIIKANKQIYLILWEIFNACLGWLFSALFSLPFVVVKAKIRFCLLAGKNKIIGDLFQGNKKLGFAVNLKEQSQKIGQSNNKKKNPFGINNNIPNSIIICVYFGARAFRQKCQNNCLSLKLFCQTCQIKSIKVKWSKFYYDSNDLNILYRTSLN